MCELLYQNTEDCPRFRTLEDYYALSHPRHPELVS